MKLGTTVQTLNTIESQKPTKVKQQNKITCSHCRKDSGWTNEDVVKIPTDVNRELKCFNCNKVCIKIMTKVNADQISYVENTQKFNAIRDIEL